MRWIFKWIFRLVFLLVVLVVLGLVFKNTIARMVLENRIRNATGLETHIGRVDIPLTSPSATIEDLKLYNTAAFGGGTLLDLPELSLTYDRDALVSSKFHILLLRLNIAELDIVKNAAGQTNITSLDEVKMKLKRLFPKSKNPSHGETDFEGIDVLNLTLGKVRFVDLKNPAGNHEININVKDEVYNNIKSADDVNSVLVLLWLRHGDEAGVSVNDLLSAFGKKHTKKSRAANAGTNSVAPP